MAVLDLEIDEYLSLYELEVQGNKFNGLEFFDFLEENCFIDDLPWLTWIDLLEEVLDLAPSAKYVGGSHEPYCYLSDGIAFYEWLGYASRVYQTTLSIIHRPLERPIDIAHFCLDVVHGVDIFYEEPSSALHLVDGTMVANYYLETVYESMDIVFEPHFNNPGVWVVCMLTASDLLVRTDAAIQEYSFNNMCDDYVMAYPTVRLGMHKCVHDRFGARDVMRVGVGTQLDEELPLTPSCECTWIGQEVLREFFQGFDTAESEKYYLLMLSDSITFVQTEDLVVELNELLSEKLDISDGATGNLARYLALAESLAATFVSQEIYQFNHSVNDSLTVDSEALVASVTVALLTDTLTAVSAPEAQLVYNASLLDDLVAFDQCEEE